MRIAAGVGGEAIGVPMAPAAVVEQVAEAEAAGVPSAWTVHFSRGLDALSVLCAAGLRTRRIALGVGVVPTYPRHPLALAQQAATVQALIGGRLTLGVGVSHRPVIEGLHGLVYERPAAHLREYLSVLVALLTDGKVEFAGEFYRVSGEVAVPGTSPVPVVVGALSPAMARVAGEGCDGVVTWLAGPRTLDEVIVPAVAAAAADAGRPAPRVIAALPVAVWPDAAEAQAAADQRFARYGTLQNYQQVFAREGIAGPGEIAIVGDETAVEHQLHRYAATGATEFWPVAFPVGPNPAGSLSATTRFLAALGPDL